MRGLPNPAEIFPVLTTKRLRLRQVEPSDVNALHACFGDADAMRYWNFPASRTLGETAGLLKLLGKTTSPYAQFAWAIADKATDECLGMVNYHHREARNRRLEIGYAVAPKHQRKGLATEAVGGFLKYCAEVLSVHRVEAFISPENVASIRLVERLNFRCEGGPIKDYWLIGEQFRSVMVYGMILKS